MTSTSIDCGAREGFEMALATGLCGEGCTFDAVNIDCSMAFRMVELAIKRMMASVGDNLEELVVARVVHPKEAALAGVNTQSWPAKLTPLNSSKLSSTPTLTRPLYLHTSSLPLLGHPDGSLLSTHAGPSFGHYHQYRSTLLTTRGLLHHHHPDLPQETTPPDHHKYRSATSIPPLVSLPLSSVQSKPFGALNEDLEVSSGVRGLQSISSLASHDNTTNSNPSSPCLKLSEIKSFELLGEIRRSILPLLAPQYPSSTQPHNIGHEHSRLGSRSSLVHSPQKILDFFGCKQDSIRTLEATFRPLVEGFDTFSEIRPLLADISTSGMDPGLEEKPGRKQSAPRRLGTPSKSIFNDYASAYHGIVASDRSASESSNQATTRGNTQSPPAWASDTNPFSPPPPIPERSSFRPSVGQPTSTGTLASPAVPESPVRENPSPGTPKSSESKRNVNFSRPMNPSPSGDSIAQPSRAIVRDSLSFFSLSNPYRRRQAMAAQADELGALNEALQAKTPGGARNIDRKGDTAGGEVIQSQPERKDGPDIRDSYEIMGCVPRQERPRLDLRPFPSGQAPNIPLPPDPSFVAARGLTREILSEPSLYDRTEKLLELSRTRERLAEEIDAHTQELAEMERSKRELEAEQQVFGERSEVQHRIDDHTQDLAAKPRMQSEFSWMGNKGESSFRDLSGKEIQQLRKTPGQPSGLLDRFDTSEYPEQGVGHADSRPHTPELAIRNEALTLTPVKSRRVPEFVHAALPRSSQEVAFENSPEEETPERETPFRPGLYMDSDSLASLIGDKKVADTERLDALLKGKHVISSQNHPERFYAVAREEGLVESAEVSDDEDAVAEKTEKRGQRQTSHYTGSPRDQTPQSVIGRDISGSSLANVSSEESDGGRSRAITPWGQLTKDRATKGPGPALRTPPGKAFTHRRNKAIDSPAAVPELFHSSSTTSEQQSQRSQRAPAFAEALALPTTPQRQPTTLARLGYPHHTPPTSHSSAHPTSHPNPFLTTPPSPETFELRDLSKSPSTRHQRSPAVQFPSFRPRPQDTDRSGDSFELSDLSKSPTARHQRSTAATQSPSPTPRHRRVRIPPVARGFPSRADIYAERRREQRVRIPTDDTDFSDSEDTFPPLTVERREQRPEQRRQVTFLEPNTVSEKSLDGSYCHTIPTHISVDGNILLNPELPHEPTFLRSVTKGSIRKTRELLTTSPLALGSMGESRRYQRIREEMGCGTGGITRVPGMQAIANSRVDPALVSDLGFYRPSSFKGRSAKRPANDRFVAEPMRLLAGSKKEEKVIRRIAKANDDINMTKQQCPAFPVGDIALVTMFRNADGTLTDRAKARRGTRLQPDGRVFEQAFCDLHQRWEFSHTPDLTSRAIRESEPFQRECGQWLLKALFVGGVFLGLGWLFLVFGVAWDPIGLRREMIMAVSMRRSKTLVVQSFHQEEIVMARRASALIFAVGIIVLALVVVYC